VSEIDELHTWHKSGHLSDEAIFVARGNNAVKRAAHRIADNVETELRRTATTLLGAMSNYSAQKLDASSEKHSELIAVASETLGLFERLFGSKFAAVEDWYLVGLRNPEDRELAQSHYAISKIASGSFDYRFPTWADGNYYWSAFDGVNYLAGQKLDDEDIRGRFDPRPLRKLKALELCAKGGGQALGIEAAGFSISMLHDSSYEKTVVSMKANRPLWKVNVADLRSPELRNEIVDAARRLGPIDLISGALPTEPWGRNGKGMGDTKDLLRPTLDLLERLRPQAFFFETDDNIRTKTHLVERDELLRAYEKMGYRVEIVDLDAAHFGIPQHGRVHTYIVGIKNDRWARYRSPAMAQRVRFTLQEELSDVAFSGRMETDTSAIDAIPTSKRTAQQRYDSWAAAWLGRHGGDLAPDVRTFDSNNVDRWLEKGITTRLKDNVLPPDNNHSALNMTIPLLQRLQSVPDDWTFVSETIEGKLEELAAMTPPRLALAIARSIHAALTDQEIDPSAEEAMKIRSGKRKWNDHPDFSDITDPEEYMARMWKLVIAEEMSPREVEIVPADLVDDDEVDTDDDWHDQMSHLLDSTSDNRIRMRLPTAKSLSAGHDDTRSSST
jgi:site-specific DNA-cytosine methylase